MISRWWPQKYYLLSSHEKAQKAQNDCLRDQAHFFSDLHGLSTALGAQLVEEATGVRLDGVFTDKQFFRDLAVAHAVRDQLQNLEFAFCDAEVFYSRFV